MSHLCQNLVVRCMDFRLNNAFNKWAEETGIANEGYDLISIAGSDKRVAEGVDEFLFDVKVSCELHQAKKIFLVFHSDCGAYALDYHFSSVEEEKKKQLEDVLKAEARIKEKYPDIEVVKVWAELQDPDGKNIKFIIQ